MCRIHRQANYLGQVVKLDECSRSIKNIHSSLVSIVVIATLSPNLWHSRLSHASLSRLQLLASQTLFGLFFFITQFPSLNFCHSSLITHHFKYYTRLASSLNIFYTICGPHTCHLLQVFFSPSTQTHRTQWKKKKKRRNPKQTEVKERRRRRRRRKKEKKNRTANQEKKREKKRKKSQKQSKVAARYCLWVSYVCLITILPLSYELWKLKTAKMCFQFP